MFVLVLYMKTDLRDVYRAIYAASCTLVSNIYIDTIAMYTAVTSPIKTIKLLYMTNFTKKKNKQENLFERNIY